MQIKQGQKVKCVGGAQIRYKYGLENLTTSKEYSVITGFGDVLKGSEISFPDFKPKCGENEFEIVDDNGDACWATLASLESEPLFEIVL